MCFSCFCLLRLIGEYTTKKFFDTIFKYISEYIIYNGL